jgi:4-hydroxy-tetrahydrodipicolinate synthase
VVSGEDNLTFPLMALGATGVISVSSNMVPELLNEMVNLCLNQRYSEARSIHQRLFCLTEALFCETNPIPVKTGMNLMAGTPAPGGLRWPDVGELRMPLCSMGEQTLVRLQREMAGVGLLAASEVGVK